MWPVFIGARFKAFRYTEIAFGIKMTMASGGFRSRGSWLDAYLHH